MNVNKNFIIIFPLIFLYIFHDFLFNYILNDTPLYYLVAWKDLLGLFFVGYIFLYFLQKISNGIYNKKYNLILFLIFMISVLTLFGIDDLLANGVSNYRFYFVNFIFFIFLALFITKHDRELIGFQTSVVWLGVVVMIYGFYQYFFYTQPEHFWYWEVFNNQGFEQKAWNAFRNGNPRISSFFTSSLDFALFIYLYSLLIFRLFVISVIEKHVILLVYFLFLSLSVITIFISTVRSAQIGLVSSFLLIGLYYFISKGLTRVYLSFLTFISLTFVTFYIISVYSSDLSALDRINEWINFFKLIPDNMLYGVGFGNVGLRGLYWFDSFWINFFLSFGLPFGMFIIVLISKWHVSFLKNGNLTIKNKANNVFYYISISTPIIFYLFVFQSFARTPALMLIFVPLFVFILNQNNKYFYMKIYEK